MVGTPITRRGQNRERLAAGRIEQHRRVQIAQREDERLERFDRELELATPRETHRRGGPDEDRGVLATGERVRVGHGEAEAVEDRGRGGRRELARPAQPK